MTIDPNSIAVTNTITANTSTTRSFTNPQQQQQRPMSPLPQVHHLHHPQHPHYSTYPSVYPAQPLSIRPLSNISSQSQGILYPVASSSRGFIHRPICPLPTSDQAVTVANSNKSGYFYRPTVGLHPTTSAGGGLQPHLDSSNHNHQMHMFRPSHNFQQQHLYHPHIVSSGGSVKGVPVSGQSKVVPTSSFPDSNGYKDTSNENKDDNVVIVRDRKVRFTDGASLYALCGSWLRNSLPEECQSQYSDAIRSLPQSLPIPVASDILRKEEVREEEDEEEEEEDKESIRHLTKEYLLKGHIKRAKKVRARLREKRLQRIARYKSRLALLLPPLIEQFRNDAATGS